ARAAFEEGEPRLGVVYLDALLERARAAGNPIWECDAFRWRALAENQVGRFWEATSDISGADAAAGRIIDPSIRARSRADVDLAAARIWRQSKPEEALRRATAALQFFQGRSVGFSVARCLAERARIHAEAGRTARAPQDLVEAIREIEGQRGRITDEGLRISFLDTSRTIFDELIGLLASTGDRAAAFEFSERARARALLEDYETSEAAPPGSAVGPLTTD